MSDLIAREKGRRVFGTDPETYDRARPGHPERVFEILVERCGLGPGTSVVEVGPGTGQATRRLLELGADPLVAIEPDEQLAEYLTTHVDGAYRVLISPLEQAALAPSAFDLAAAASSFHWIEPVTGLDVLYRALRPGGWIALWWTGFGDPSRPDRFHDATTELLRSMPKSPAGSHQGGRTPAEGGGTVWLGALTDAGFVDGLLEEIPWRRTFDAKAIRDIFSTFSPLLVVDEGTRTRVLDELERIAATDFGDRVEKPLLSAVYTARKPTEAVARTIRLVATRTMLPVHAAPTCSVAGAAEIVGSKWTVLIVHDLSEGPRRFTQLERSCAGISPRTLAERLRWLEAEEIVERQSYPESPPRVEYALTEKGRALLPVVREMRRFGHEWLGCGVHDPHDD